MRSSIGREAIRTKDVLRGVEAAGEVTLPRGMRQAMRTGEQYLKVIETKSLRSSAGSRSSAGEDASMAELVASIAELGIIEPIVVRQVEADP